MEKLNQIKCNYLGDLKCNALHMQSGSKIITDAPTDHCGKGENFSPSDLLATSIGTCFLTIMAIKARHNGWELENIYLIIKKIMTKNSERKIKELLIDIYIPETISKDKFHFLQIASEDCPVKRNLSESLILKIKWHHK